jgi:hypothetical protein
MKIHPNLRIQHVTINAPWTLKDFNITYDWNRHADCLYEELKEEVAARAETIRTILPLLFTSLQEGPDGGRAQSYFLSLVRAAVCHLVQLFERNQLRASSTTGEFLNNMDYVLESDPSEVSLNTFADKAKALVRHALAVAAAASGHRREDDRDISVICKNVVERLGRLEEERMGEVQDLLELLEERVNSALLRQLTDHLSCVDQPLDTLIHR